MSYYLLKNVSFNEKKNTIFVTVACNNVRPIEYHKWEYCDGENYRGYTFNDKVKAFLRDVLTGELQPQTSLYKLNFAIEQAVKLSGYSRGELSHIIYAPARTLPLIYYKGAEARAWWLYATPKENIMSLPNDANLKDFEMFEECDGIKYYHNSADYARAMAYADDLKNDLARDFLSFYNEKPDSAKYVVCNQSG